MTTEAQIKLRNYIDERHGKNGFTQEKLCASMGFSTTYLAQLLSGKKSNGENINPTRRIMTAIAKETGGIVKLNDWNKYVTGTSDN